MKTTYCEVYVPRQHTISDMRSHVLVKLTIVHDWKHDTTFIKSAFLPFAISMLGERRCLPDKCKCTLLMTDILARIVEESDMTRDLLRQQHAEQ